MSKTFSYFDDDECVECGAVNIRESSIPGVCTECNPSGGSDSRKHKNQILIRTEFNKVQDKDF